MRIEGIGNRYAFGLQGDRKNRTESDQESSVLQRQNQSSGEDGQATVERSHRHHHAHANGAIRNLQEAHFQGVASLRLQMNFHEQLQENRIQKADEALATGSDQLVADLGDQVSTLGEDFQGSFGNTDIITEMKGLLDTFSQAVSSLFSDSEESDPSSATASASNPTDIIAGMQKAFGDFFDALWQLGQPSTDGEVVDTSGSESAVTVEDTESPDTGTVSVSGDTEGTIADTNTEETVNESVAIATTDSIDEDTTTPSFTDRLTELQTWFDSQIASLQTSVDELMAMPPIGHHRGHGVAYSRFLEIYTAMNSTESIGQTGDTASQEEGLETEA